MARVNEIRYVGYGVSDLAAERAFYRDVWKLREVGTQDDMVYFACEGHNEHHVVRLRQAEQQRIDVIALAAADRADVDALHDKVVAAGCKIIFDPQELQALGGGYGFRFFSPDGLPFEVSSDVARGPSRPRCRRRRSWRGFACSAASSASTPYWRGPTRPSCA
ncbi:VOC family protein [Sphingomonas sp. HMP6]|uniref:VOC family protein n=1 Tax=Sphingomonas sp. HMP6 TaxID=1517551 RepID=UPI0015964280|nr:hypothetical protein HMP06_1987 [Sphingomonas sp. HMP6]